MSLLVPSEQWIFVPILETFLCGNLIVLFRFYHLRYAVKTIYKLLFLIEMFNSIYIFSMQYQNNGAAAAAAVAAAPVQIP